MLSSYQVTKRIEYLEQKWASMKKKKLSDEEGREICAIANDAEVKGMAQPAQFSGYLHRDTVGQQMTGYCMHMAL